MRLGCGGCLTVLLILALAAGAVWGVMGLFLAPDIAPVTARHEDWVTAQQKIFDLFRGNRGRKARGQTMTLTERELTALLSRQLSGATALPLSGASVRLLSGGAAEVTGQVPLRVAVRGPVLAWALDWLPAGWGQRPIWMVARLRPRLDGTDARRRFLALDVERFRIGRTRLPSLLPRLLLPATALRYLTVPVPESVEGVSIERGRLLLRVAP